jgi:hypothetical protein
MSKNAALQICLELFHNVFRERTALGISLGDEAIELFLDNPITGGQLRSAPGIRVTRLDGGDGDHNAASSYSSWNFGNDMCESWGDVFEMELFS